MALTDGTERSRVRVLLVDDDPLVRAGLRMILSSAADLEVVGEAGDGAAAVGAVAEHHPDVVLMDIRMPGVDGITATRTVRAAPDPPQVIVLTTFHADDSVLRALRAGAGGFLLKDTAPEEIVGAVRLVHAGEAMLSPAVTRTLIGHVTGDTSGDTSDDPSGDATPDSPTDGTGGGGSAADDRRSAARARLATLTGREHEVAVAVGRGASNAEIAASLYMSEATVKAHVSRLLAKLAAANRVQVAIVVHDAGLG
ncbi:two component transcriptional regulator, LuxR family [Jatrophihabitans endophyticus]|uniref:Two component transcriptional regulator, LuxR family n=1 Tax=Jatrophihabitans endophyticus TaxID=1206085 RepID=A0A1M5HJG0_9ACTN|nr:response regulator transcription factor [Jatrophihabitans endophyticus]SHG16103.1 two component transcriptional regulator, LuxR family [Jatrophihabitans endophyticus]